MRLCSVSATRRTRPLLPTRLAGAPPSDTQPTGDSSPLLPIWRPAVTPCESTMAAAMPTIPRTPPGCAHASRNEKRVQRARHCKGGIQEENRVQRTARMKKEKLGRRNQGQAKKEKAGPPPEPAAYSLRLSPPPPRRVTFAFSAGRTASPSPPTRARRWSWPAPCRPERSRQPLWTASRSRPARSAASGCTPSRHRRRRRRQSCRGEGVPAGG